MSAGKLSRVESRMVVAALLSLALHVAVLSALLMFVPWPWRKPVKTTARPDPGPVLSIRLLPAPVVAGLPTAVTAAQGKGLAGKPAVARPFSASLTTEKVVRARGSLDSHHSPVRGNAAYSPSPGAIQSPSPQAIQSAPSESVPTDNATSASLPVAPSEFARRYVRSPQAADAALLAVPSDTPEGRRIDRLYARAERGSRRGWEEHPGPNGSSVVRFSAGACAKIEEPLNREHRELNKTIQTVGCPD